MLLMKYQSKPDEMKKKKNAKRTNFLQSTQHVEVWGLGNVNEDDFCDE